VSDNVELQIRAKNLTQEAFNKVSEALKALEAQSAQTATKSSASFSGLASSVKGHLGEMGSGLEAAFTHPIEGVQQLAGSIGHTLKDAIASIGPEGAIAAAGLGAMLAVASGIVAITVGLASHAATAGEEVLAFSQKTGIAIQNVGALQFAVTAAGGSLDSISSILQHLTLKEATDQGGRFSAALKDIGINADAFHKMDNESKILALAHGFQQGAKSGNDMGAAIALMGRSGAESLPLLHKLTDDLLHQGEKLGVQWTENSVKAAEQFSVGMKTVETAIGGIATRIGLALLPAVTDMVTKLANSPTFIDGVTSAAVTLAHGLGYVIEGFGYVVAGALNMGAELTRQAATVEAFAVSFDSMVLSVLKGMSYLPGSTLLVGAAVQQVAGDLASHVSHLKTLADVDDKLSQSSKAVADGSKAIGAALQGVTAQSVQAVETQLSLNRVHNDGGAAAEKYAKAVQAIVDALEGDSLKTRETSDAIGRVIALGQDDVDVKTRVVAAIEKLIAGHVKLTAAEQAYFDANKGLTKESAKGLEDLEKLHNEYYQLVAKGEGETLATKLAANQKAYDDYVLTLEKTKALNANYDAELAAAQQVKTQKDKNAKAEQLAAEQKFAAETGKLEDEYAALAAKDANQTTEAKLAAVETWLHGELSALDEAKVGEEKFAERVGVLDQLRAIKRKQILDDRAKEERAHAQEITDLWAQTDSILLAQSGDTVTAQLKDVQRWYDDQVAKHREAHTDSVEFYQAIQALTAAKTQDIIHAQDPLWQAWKGLTVDMRTSMASTWEQVLSGAKSWKDAMLQPFHGLWDGIKKILAGILADFEQQLFSPLLKLAHNAIGQLVSAISGAASGGAGGGAGIGGLLGGLLGGGGAAAGGGAALSALPGTVIPLSTLGIPGLGAGAGAAGAGLFGLGSFATAGILAGVTAAIPAIGGLIKKVFGTAGRDAVEQFTASQGGFDALHKQLNQLGAEGEKLWINLTQGVGRNNPAQAAAAVKQVQDALANSPAALAAQAGFKTNDELKKAADDAEKMYEYVRDSGKYSADVVAEAWKRAQQAMADAGDTQAIAAQRAVAAAGQLTDIMGKSELDALHKGYAQAQEEGFKGAESDFLSQQLEFYQTLKEGDARLKTWFSGTTIDAFNLIKSGGGDLAKSLTDKIKSLNDETQSLVDSIANEAPEEVMGVIEQQTRARIAQLEKDKEETTKQLHDAADAAVKSAADAAKQAGADTADAVQYALEHRDFHVRVKVDLDGFSSGSGSLGSGGDDGSGEGLPAHADGAYIREDHVARVHAGEIIGPMSFMTQALAGALAATGGGGGALVAAPIVLDGQKVADLLVRRVPAAVQRFGVKKR
jgi:hypothetical protein